MDESIKLPYTQLLSKANSLLDQDIKVDKPIVVAWGLMNAGKSFLLNMLTNHIETECFRTNDIRETAELKSFETEDFIFFDTPGLDANNGDDLIANEGAAKADIVLFVHQPQGELEKIEIDILRKLKGSFGQFAEQNIILVLSKSDDETPDKISAIEQRMLEQCRDDLGFTPRCFAISGSRFQTGVTQKIDGLVTASHLYDLAKHLDSLNTGVGAVKRERQMIAIEEMIAEFKQVELALHARKLQAKQKIQNGFAPFNKAMDNFRVGMKQNLNIFSSI